MSYIKGGHTFGLLVVTNCKYNSIYEVTVSLSILNHLNTILGSPIPDVRNCGPNPRLYIHQYSVGPNFYKEKLSVIFIIRNYWMELALI